MPDGYITAQDPNDNGKLKEFPDADDDGFVDIYEDDDADGLRGWQEFKAGTSDDDSDTDDDGILDAQDDSDGDGLTNLAEIVTHRTDPKNADTDGDGLNDGLEIAYGTKPAELYVDYEDHYETANNFNGRSGWSDRIDYNKTVGDSDQDGISDGDEIKRGYNPAKADSDDDGLRDGTIREQIQTKTGDYYSLEGSPAETAPPASAPPADDVTIDVNTTIAPLDVAARATATPVRATAADVAEADVPDGAPDEALQPVDPSIFETDLELSHFDAGVSDVVIDDELELSDELHSDDLSLEG